MLLKTALDSISNTNKNIISDTQALLDNLTKPPGSLGKIEEIVTKIASIRGIVKPSKLKKAIVNMAGDHGVVEEGVSAFPQEVTPQMVMNFVNGGAAINVFSRLVDAELILVDMGVATDLPALPQIISKKVAYGTNNICKGPAMTVDEAIKAIESGISVAYDLVDKGIELIGLGEMGIGNTTPSAALASVICDIEPSRVAGRGTGLDSTGVAHKASIIEKAIRINKPDKNNILDVLSKLGGYEIAGLAGIIIGCASKRTPVIIDGFISTAAALIAVELQPLSAEYLIASHLSTETGHDKMLQHLGLEPMLLLEMRLGEGTGAALAMQLIDAAIAVLNEMATFDQAGISGAI